jgi:lipopolysaccharide/colanic/teichoic acid biosynthesis glycosyltransferase
VRSANKTLTVRSPDYSVAGSHNVAAIDPAIVTNDPAPVFLFGRAAKRAFDIFAAAIGLVIFSPTFLLASIAIRIDSRGPVFSLQTRHGYYNENIPLLKFRSTMVTEAGKSTSSVTRVGGVLHRTGIDCLPRLINVLRGEMSIVGPSPYVAVPNEIFPEETSLIQRRCRVKPGITGWAQVNGCWGESSKTIRQGIEYDLYYIDNWSFFFDIRIILMTLYSRNSYSNR